MALPKVASRQQWLEARLALLAVRRIMVGVRWDAACLSGTEFTRQFAGALVARWRSRGIADAMVGRAPWARIEAGRAVRGWTAPGAPPAATSGSRRMSRSRSCKATTARPGTGRGERACERPGVSCLLRGGELFQTEFEFFRSSTWLETSQLGYRAWRCC